MQKARNAVSGTARRLLNGQWLIRSKRPDELNQAQLRRLEQARQLMRVAVDITSGLTPP